MTLIEVLVVIILIALASAGATMGIGAVTRAKLRSASMRIVSASRFAYHRAITNGKTIRVVLDMGSGLVSVDEGRAGIVLANPRQEREEDEPEAVDPWALAKARLDNPLAPVLDSSAFTPITDEDGEVVERYQPHPLGDGIRVVRIIAPHLPEPQTEGTGALYFFPSGRSHTVVVHLEDARGRVLSVEINGLTGRGTIHDGAYEPPEVEDTRNDPRDPG